MTSVAAWLLTGCGLGLVGIGAFFIWIRPPLLPEDVRFMSSSIEEAAGALPGLGNWLRHVFWVLGGYVVATGLLVLYVANTSIRSGSDIAVGVLTLTGMASLGWMTVVNFLLRSDFKWALLALALVWTLGLVLAVVAR